MGKKHLCLRLEQIICRFPWLYRGFLVLCIQYNNVSGLLLWNSLWKDPIPIYCQNKLCLHLFYVFTASFLCPTLISASTFRLPGDAGWRRRGGRVSYSGKQRLEQLSKHCQQCSWALEKDLLVLLCVLSEVTSSRLWILSRTSTSYWCPTGSRQKCELEK